MKVHFIGIGGIGVSALARYYLSQGHKVYGSDLSFSEITKALKKLGAKIFIGKHQTKNLAKNLDLVIYSPAVLPDNPEILAAKKMKIKAQSYPQALGELTKKYFTIAVAGSHGKSTTVAMIGILLTKAGLDPTVIVGTKVREFGDSNCRVGKSKYLVIEADEHFASFLNYWPKIIVLTTLEPDHLDYYKNFKNYINAFKKFIQHLSVYFPAQKLLYETDIKSHRKGAGFISHLPKEGILVANKDDKNISRLKIKDLRFKVKNYSLKQKEVKKIKKVLKIPGEFNVSNALAVLTVARVLKIPDKISFKALSEYRGSWRRFEVSHRTWNTKHITIINDYAHHPTQVKVTLKVTREKFPKKKIWCIFQPHQYQRTYYLFNDFVKVFKEAPINKIIITDIYSVAGREKKEIIKKVSSQKLVKAINKPSVIYLPKKDLKKFLKKNLRGSRLKKGEPRSRGAGEVLIILGAGDIYKLASDF